MRTTESSEDYLEAILRIRSERGSRHNVDIACLLGYSKASVIKALAGLSTAGLAEVVARDVRLTPEGERIARRTLGRHRFFGGGLALTSERIPAPLVLRCRPPSGACGSRARAPGSGSARACSCPRRAASRSRLST